MELLHAYSIDRIQKMATPVSPRGLYRIKGTPFDWQAGSDNAAITINQSLGLTVNHLTSGLGIDLTPYVTGGVDPYWITVGWMAYCSTQRAVTSGQDAIRLSNGLSGGYTSVISFVSLFNSLPATSNYVELSYNPVTNTFELYVNGVLVTQGTAPGRFLHLAPYLAFSEFTYIREIYVARFNNVERRFLRRWGCETLVPATNNIGAGILNTDGTMSTVKEVGLAATYPIPAAALGISVDVSAVSPDLTSALKVDTTDGTKSISKTSSVFIRTLDAGIGAVGHAVSVGGLTPTKDATTLTVTATALDRT